MKIGIKSGTFSLIHSGHIFALEFCKKHCDYLIILINDNDYVLQKKGFIAIDQKDRKKILKSIRYVDEVHIFSGNNEDNWIKDFKKNSIVNWENNKLVVFHSAEIYGGFIPGNDYANEIIYVPRIEGSTTDIIEKIQNAKR